jgi:hypothetical protein
MSVSHEAHIITLPLAEKLFVGVVGTFDEQLHSEPVDDPADATSAGREEVINAEAGSSQVEMMRAKQTNRSQPERIGITEIHLRGSRQTRIPTICCMQMIVMRPNWCSHGNMTYELTSLKYKNKIKMKYI